MATPILDIPELANGQVDQYLTANEAFRLLEAAGNDYATVDLSAGNAALTSEQLVQHAMFMTSGNTVARTLTVPASKRLFLVSNGGSAELTVTVGATDVGLAAGTAGLFYGDGTPDGLISIAGGGGGGDVQSVNGQTGVVVLDWGGYKNKLINGDFRINQREFDGDWSALAEGAYGYDRWKKSGSDIQQIIEDGNFTPSTTHTMSGTGVTTQQIISPASGNWTITVPNTATTVQVEEGSVATPFEQRFIGTERAMCQRYCRVYGPYLVENGRVAWGQAISASDTNQVCWLHGGMRATPSLSYAGDIYVVSAAGVRVAVSGLALGGSSTPEAVVINTAGSSGLVAGDATQLLIGTVGGRIMLDAEL